MKKNRGFTLIELIAVITILSLIVLIGVPAIINTLNKAEQKEYEEFEKIIKNAAELYLERNRDLYSDFNNAGDSIDISTDVLVNEGYLKNNLVSPIDDMPLSRYKVSVLIGQDNIFEYLVLSIKTLSQLATTSDEVSSINACASSGKCETGTMFALEVNDKETYNFYVINDDGNEVTLIMDRNLGNKVAWASEVDYGCGAIGDKCSTNAKGPITALNYLNNQTSFWYNIDPIVNYTYNNNLNGNTNKDGYQKLTITNGTGVLTSQDGSTTNLTGTMKARLLTYEEANTLRTNNGNTTPTWLYENLSVSNTDASPKSHWYLTANPVLSNYGDYINYLGDFTNHLSDAVYDVVNSGIRPVVTVPKHL